MSFILLTLVWPKSIVIHGPINTFRIVKIKIWPVRHDTPRSIRTLGLNNPDVMIWKVWAMSSCTLFADHCPGRVWRRIRRSKSTSGLWIGKCPLRRNNCAKDIPPSFARTLNIVVVYALKIVPIMPTWSVCSRNCFIVKVINMITCLIGPFWTCNKNGIVYRQVPTILPLQQPTV